jgi:hypothetical protein
MAKKQILKSVNFDLFNRIINGNLRPFLKDFDTDEKVKKIYDDAKVIQKGIFSGKVDFFETIDLVENGFKDGDEFVIEITDQEDGTIQAIIKNLTEENLEELIDIDIPPPPNLKGEYFEFIVEREYKSLVIRIDNYLHHTSIESELKLFANKNIQLLKKLAEDAHRLKKKLYKEDLDDLDNPDTYVIYLLKTYILRLILLIQKRFEPFLTIPAQSETALRIELYEYHKTLAEFKKLNDFIEAKKAKNKNVKIISKKTSFCYTHSETSSLLNTIKQLCLKINLLNQALTSPEQLLEVFTAKEINLNLPKIYFDCDTTQVRYIFDKLKPHFSNLTLALIESSKLFISNSGNLLTAQNLSSSKIQQPKNYKEADKIFLNFH